MSPQKTRGERDLLHGGPDNRNRRVQAKTESWLNANARRFTRGRYNVIIEWMAGTYAGHRAPPNSNQEEELANGRPSRYESPGTSAVYR